MFKKGAMFFLFIMIFSSAALYAQEEENNEQTIETGTMTGQLLIKDGGPLSRGMIVLFDGTDGPPPDPNEYLRIPDEIGDLDEEGKFLVTLPVGKYYLGAIKRMSGEMIGPPLDGDYFFLKRDKKGAPELYVIQSGMTVDIGTVADAVPFKREIPKGAIGISGTVTDMEGAPIKGAIVFAYVSQTMTGLPAFTSYKTGKDGKYFVGMNRGGTYFLRIRDIYGGGPPVEGSVMGRYGEEKPISVTVAAGKVSSNVDIKIVRHFVPGPTEEDLERMKKAEEQAKDEKTKKENTGKYKQGGPK